MKNIYNNINKIGRLAFLVLLTMTISFGASAQSFVLDLQYNAMSFTNANKTLLTNTGNNGNDVGSIHKYDNVIIFQSVTVYAKLEIKEINNAFIVNFDDDAITGEQHRFQPRIGSYNGGGFIVYELSFFDAADDTPVFIYNYYMTGVDIDGNGNNKEYAEVGGYTSYQLDASTLLTPSTNQTTGRTRMLGRSTSLSGVTFDNTASFIANFENSNNKISFALGQTAQNNIRYYSVQFGAEGGDFDDPVVVNNPLPIAVDDQGIPIIGANGGISVPNILDNDLYDGNPIVPSEVNISIVDAGTEAGVVLNTATGEVTVAPGTPAGTYEIVYKICMVADASACDIAIITVPVEAITIVENEYPANGFGTLAFEDLWPGKGDYDFNDLVVDFKFVVTTNQNNKVSEINATFVIQAFGAVKENGFGFQLAEAIDGADLTVTGSELTESYITLAANGVEAGQSRPTIIVFDNAYNQMTSPGGIGVNTDPNYGYVTPDILNIKIVFTPNKYTLEDLDIASFNPFLIADLDRGIEVHLPNYLPTDLVDNSYFGTSADDSDANADRYYKTINNLPWAIKIYETFNYPIEKIEIIDAHLKFEQWAISDGVDFSDWYKDLTGYRNQANIYETP